MYYTSGCADWRWMYPHHYAPLMQDVARVIPTFDMQFVKPKPPNPIDPLSLLAYVTPKASIMSLLPTELATILLQKHPDWYKDVWKFRWAYCRYFWESHAVMQHIDLDLIEKYVREYRLKFDSNPTQMNRIECESIMKNTNNNHEKHHKNKNIIRKL
jgi:5'-3' exonuclease